MDIKEKIYKLYKEMALETDIDIISDFNLKKKDVDISSLDEDEIKELIMKNITAEELIGYLDEVVCDSDSKEFIAMFEDRVNYYAEVLDE